MRDRTARYDELLENNRRWAEQKTRTDPEYFLRLSREQHPEFLYIGCSDSRVPADQLMGVESGDVFVHRNIANLVNNSDLNVMAVIDFAVLQLDIKHIIVCGHYNCGGVRAAMQPRDMGLLNPWLRNIRDVYRLHQQELQQIAEEGARYNRLVELNVAEQCINVIKTASVQQCYVAKGYPVVHGWVFNLQTGRVADLKINFKEELQSIQEIYNLTDKKLF